MSKAEDPRRLELNASPPLRDALSALRGDGPSAAELGRMAERLAPLLDAEAVAPAVARGFTAKLVKLGLSLFALAAAVAWLILDGRADESRPLATSHSPAQHPAEQHLPPSQHAPSQPAAGPGAPEEEVAHPERPGEVAAAPAAPAARARPSAQRARKAKAVHAPVIAPRGVAPSSEALAVETAPAETAAPIEHAPAPAVAAGDAGGSRASAAPTVERAPVPREQPLSEAALLHQARRIARDDPRRALALLDQHERRFASGMLVQERELLAVELLQALGRVEAARARLQAFRTRFPDSIYLQRGVPHR